MFPFTTGDIDAGEIIKRCRIPKEFKKYATISNWCDWSNNGNLPEGQYNHIKCKTVFKNTFVYFITHTLVSLYISSLTPFMIAITKQSFDSDSIDIIN